MELFWQFLQLQGGTRDMVTKRVNIPAERIAANGGEVKDFKFQTAPLSGNSVGLYVGIVYEAPASIVLDM